MGEAAFLPMYPMMPHMLVFIFVPKSSPPLPPNHPPPQPDEAGPRISVPFHARIPATFEVNPLVPDQERLSKVQAELVPRVEQKLRRRLPAPARLVRRF